MLRSLSMADLDSGPGHPIPARWEGQDFKEWHETLTRPQYERVRSHMKRLALTERELFEALVPLPVGRPAMDVVAGDGPTPPRGRVLHHRRGAAVMPKTTTITGEGEIP